jgi:DNA modification methylase
VWCGDARERDTVTALCAGDPPALLFTDPPYNVAYRAEAVAGRAGASGRTTGRRVQPLGPIAGDDLAPDAYLALITDALANACAVLRPGGVVYVCGGTSTMAVYDAAFAATGLTQSGLIVWDKGRPTLGRRDYHSQYELLSYGWKGGAAHHYAGGRSQTDLWTIPPDAGAVYVHPTQKPVALAARAIRNSTHAGAVVLDLFGGSGTTLIAAEQTGRQARLLELDPHYVDVIVARWETYTGQVAEPWRAETEAAHA